MKTGDRVRITFWPGVNDVVGVIDFVPSGPGDVWGIMTESGLVLVMHFATVKIEEEVK